jgi:ATP-binding cassette subfamily C protein CydCD
MRLDRADRPALYGFALLGSLQALALVLIAEGVARGVTGSLELGATLIAIGAVLRAVLAWIGQLAGARAAIGTKQRLRARLAARLTRGGAPSSVAVTATLGLDELDAWYRTVLPAIASTATVPLLIGARILAADWVSALIIVLTVPLVPLFMVLVGLHTQQRADAATATIERLASHVAELARGLPVLVGLGRVAEQSAALARIDDAHRVATVRTLRSAFLSSLVLELISTISVAVVAVFVGLRLLSGDLSLEVGLLALVLAPECFAPFRELGSAFHASRAGVAAKSRVTEVLEAPEPGEHRQPGDTIAVRGLDIRTVHDLSFALPRGSVTAITGASGAGKSSVLGVLAGTVSPESGEVRGVDASSVAYAPQHPHCLGETVRAELALYGENGDDLLADFGLDGDANPATLSPGELRRLAVARALLRVREGAELLLLDEPTAHLDAHSAGLVENAVAALRGTVTIVVVSHERAMVDLADHVVSLGDTTLRDASGGEAAVMAGTAVETAPADTAPLGELAAFLHPARWRWVAGTLLGVAATLSGLALLATSGWLIVEASEVDAIMFLLVAIVGVRFFGLGRAVLRYCERLVSHDAALASVGAQRQRLWAALAERGLASRALASGDAALDYLVAAPEAVLQLVPRIVPPIAIAWLSAVAVVVTAALLAPSAVPVLLVALAVALLAAPIAAIVADRRASRAVLAARSTALRDLSRMARAADDLRANGVADRARRQLERADAAATAAARRAALATGLGSALVLLACVLASAAMLGAGIADRSILAVMVLIPLGLVDPLLGAVTAAQQLPALRAQLAKTRALTVGTAHRAEQLPGDPLVRIENLAVAWPGAEPVFRQANAEIARGEWLVVEGPSGSGKSTLVAALLGYLPSSAGTLEVRGSGVAWAPQEAHIFDSTVRGNLLLAGPADDERLERALAEVGLEVGLDERVGSEGSRLSGGQRQRLAVARALLTDADVVLLDEPTAHLDASAADELMRDLRIVLADKAVVLVTHHASESFGGEVLRGDRRLRLGAVPAYA